MLIPATNGADCDNVSTPCALAKRIVGHYQPGCSIPVAVTRSRSIRCY
jgi:hypothetical protein